MQVSPDEFRRGEGGRTWSSSTELLAAIRDDLAQPGWIELDRPGGMSLLRCLDIVGWHVGI